jgi:hypothetical protein
LIQINARFHFRLIAARLDATVKRWRPSREVLMAMHSDNKGRGLANNFWFQMAVLAIVVIVVIVLVAKYVW